MSTSVARYLSHACLVLTIGFFSGHALADDNDTGFYLGAGYGQFNTKIKNVEDVTNVIGDIDTDDGAWKAFAGWRIIKFLSIEADYIDLGNPRGDFNAAGSDGNYRVELSGFGAYVIGILPITIFELTARAGYYWHDVKVDVNLNNVGANNGNVLHTDDNGDAFVYGVGAGVTVIDHLNFSLEYERMEIDRLNDTYNLWVTAAWRF